MIPTEYLPKRIDCPECEEPITRGGDHHPQCPHLGKDGVDMADLLDEIAAREMAEQQLEEYRLRGRDDE